METRAHYVAVGAFVLTMVVLAFAAVLWFGQAELTTQFNKYDIYFIGPVSGLRVGAAVEYSGVPVGKVTAIHIERNGPHPDKPIRVTVDIDQSVPILSDADAAVETNILSGVSYIQIVSNIKTGQEPTPLKAAPGRYPEIRSHRSRFATVAARLPQLLVKAEEAMDHVNELLNEQNRQAIAETIANIRALTAGLSETNKHIDDLAINANTAALTLTNLLGNVDRSYAGPDGLGERAAKGLADFDHLATNLSDTNRQLQGILQDVRPGVKNFSQQTLSDVGALVGDARQLIAELNRLTAQIERDPSRVLFGDRREGYRLK
jgi:phospholipid/cholesterol/gamma-HCH transport system substrate-binding protein